MIGGEKRYVGGLRVFQKGGEREEDWGEVERLGWGRGAREEGRGG